MQHNTQLRASKRKRERERARVVALFTSRGSLSNPTRSDRPVVVIGLMSVEFLHVDYNQVIKWVFKMKYINDIIKLYLPISFTSLANKRNTC